MLNLEPVRSRFGDYICRTCLNKKYNVNLQPKDCNHFFYGVCRCCSKDKKLVTSLTPSGKVKMLLK